MITSRLPEMASDLRMSPFLYVGDIDTPLTITGLRVIFINEAPITPKRMAAMNGIRDVTAFNLFLLIIFQAPSC